MRCVLDKCCRGNQNTHLYPKNFFCRKSCHLWGNVEKYGRTGQVIGDKMSHVYCMLNTTRICNTYCFFTGTIVSRNASLLRHTHIACLFNFRLRVSDLYYNWLYVFSIGAWVG